MKNSVVSVKSLSRQGHLFRIFPHYPRIEIAPTLSVDHFLTRNRWQQHSIVRQILNRKPSHGRRQQRIFHNTTIYMITETFIGHFAAAQMIGTCKIYREFSHLEVTKSKFNYVKLRVTDILI